MSDEEDRKMDEANERVQFAWAHGLDPIGSVAMRLAGVRELIRKLKELEAEIERDVRGGGFNLEVPGEGVRVVVAPDGAVLLVHTSEQSDG